MNRNLRLIIVCYMIPLMTAPLFSMAEEPACRKKIADICNANREISVCRLLFYTGTETVGSVSEFLNAIKDTDSEIRKELICARLVGKKQISGIRTELDESPHHAGGKYTFRSGIGIFEFAIDNPDYTKLIEAHKKARKLRLCPSEAVEFDIEGMVIDAKAEYSGSGLKYFKILMDNVIFSNIRTRYAQGGFDVQLKPLEKKMEEEYQRLLDTGIRKEKKSEIPVNIVVRQDLKTYKNSLGMEFVLIPPGTMGENGGESGFECNEKVRKIIITNAFYIGRFEVTQGQWKTVMGNNPSFFGNCGEDCPVENISYDDIAEFLKRLNAKEANSVYRLPTEAEWEYAARAGSTGDYYFGDDVSLLKQYAWYGDNSGSQTHPVGKLLPNAWGLYDMHGNVWEWCLDWYGDHPSDQISDPEGPSSGLYRVLRGGSWDHYARFCRCDHRGRNMPDFRSGSVGFRLVKSNSEM